MKQDNNDKPGGTLIQIRRLVGATIKINAAEAWQRYEVVFNSSLATTRWKSRQYRDATDRKF